MNREVEELMQKSIIKENQVLSDMVKDIEPEALPERKFTDLELEAEKKETFSIVVYKKENPIIRFFKNIKFSLEKIKIMNSSKEFELQKQDQIFH